MADIKEKGKEVDQSNQRFRITISCIKLASIEQVTNEIIRNAKEQGIKITGPVRMPNKNLKITCRRTPCGNGSKTWDKFEMRIFKRYIDLDCINEQVKQVTAIKLPAGVDVNVIVNKWSYLRLNLLQIQEFISFSRNIRIQFLLFLQTYHQ